MLGVDPWHFTGTELLAMIEHRKPKKQKTYPIEIMKLMLPQRN